MNQRQSKSQPNWTDVKNHLASFDRMALLGLIQDLYRANKDNQTFLHARFAWAPTLMFEQAVIIVSALEAGPRDAFVARLDHVRSMSHECGYGVGDAMDFILDKYPKRGGRSSTRRQP